jgi:hypothetical protein
MGKQRFLTRLWLGVVISLCLACSQRVLLSGVAAPLITPTPTEITAPRQAQPGNGDSTQVAAALSPAARDLIDRVPGGMANPPKKDLRLVVISDLNSAYGSTTYDPEVDQAIALLPVWQPDLVVCGGDMIAGQKLSLTPTQIQAMWQAFDAHVAAPLRQQGVPFGFTVGNHDASAARRNGQFVFQRERDLATAFWNDPRHNPGVRFVDRYQFPFYYTFEQGGVFFMAWDGSSHQIPADQLAWVERSLASEAAQQAKTRILITHLPLYGIAVGRDKPGEVLANADQLRAMLERYRVHTVISGHQHAYYPGHRGQLQLLHAGILGSGPRPLVDSGRPPQKTLTVVDFDFSDPALTTYTTYDSRTLRTLDTTELPRFIAGHNGMVLRRDLRYADLAPDEQAFCQGRLGASLCTARLPFPRPKTYVA